MAGITFQSLYSRVMGDVPRIPLNKAQQCVQDAWRDINESRLWSFNIQETRLLVPGLTSAGTATVTYGSNQVGFDATAQAAIAAIPPYTLITKQQFRVQQGDIYNITAYNPGTGVATLDEIYADASAASTGYQIYQCYYSVTPPNNATFQAWESIMDPINGYTFKKVGLRKADLDMIDPYRQSFDNPVYAAAYKLDPNGNMLYELWPHPTVQQPYQCLYRTNGGNLVSDSDTLPPQVTRNVVEARALWYAAQWGELNKTIVPGAQGVNFIKIMELAMADWNYWMDRLWTSDEDAVLSYWIRYDPCDKSPGLDTGLYLQAHDGLGVLFPYPFG